VRLKLDENLPEDARLAALALGDDVDTVLDEALGGSSDPDVLAAAIAIVRGHLVRIRRPD